VMVLSPGNSQLGIAYRVVNIVSGELNDAAAKKYDLEVSLLFQSCVGFIDAGLTLFLT